MMLSDFVNLKNFCNLGGVSFRDLPLRCIYLRKLFSVVSCHEQKSYYFFLCAATECICLYFDEKSRLNGKHKFLGELL